jgi:hypothetical protein
MTDPAAQPPLETEEGAHAHQPGGEDSSDQLDAAIADENMIPDELPE